MADQVYAALKAAAWQAVAALGANRAIELLQSIIAEIRDAEWKGR